MILDSKHLLGHLAHNARKHIYTDLEPYVCLFEDCKQGKRTFQSRHKWLQHQADYHWKLWTCCFGCSLEFQSEQALESHLIEYHQKETVGQLKRILQDCARLKNTSFQTTCPLCLGMMLSEEKCMKHLARHLRELSLFALPSYPTEDVEENDREEDNMSDSSDDSDFPMAKSDSLIHGNENRDSHNGRDTASQEFEIDSVLARERAEVDRLLARSIGDNYRTWHE